MLPWRAGRSVHTPIRNMLDAVHWRERAKEVRALAEQATDQISRDQMLQIAANYDKLADRNEAALRQQIS